MKRFSFRLSAGVLLAWLFWGCQGGDLEVDANGLPVTEYYQFNAEELELISIINSYRNSIGLEGLQLNGYVSFLAEEHNLLMISNNYIGHMGFVSRSEVLKKKLKAVKIAENIAYNYQSPKGAFQAWLNSLGHKIVLEGDFNILGVSIRKNQDQINYYTVILIKTN